MTIETYLDDLTTYLTAQGYTNIYKHHLDEFVNDQIALAPWGGTNPTDVKTEEGNFHVVYLSILVKNTNEATARLTATRIYELLRLKSNFTLGDTRFLLIKARGPPGFVTTVKTGAAIFSCNYSLTMT